VLEIEYSKAARKALLKIPRDRAHQIREKITQLAENPARPDLDIKPLVGTSLYRLRVGTYRVIFSEDGLVLDVQKITPRGSAY
jgi:mRNA interferase RelE/StbE